MVALPFLPGQEPAAPGRWRSADLLSRVLALSDAEVVAELDAVRRAFTRRHRGLEATWRAHAALLAHRLPVGTRLSADREHLVGAYFTKEYALQGAAVLNPSLVAHPDQSGLAAGTLRFAMTLRAVGEGHLSSVEWRTGTVDAAGAVELDPAPAVAVLPTATPVAYVRADVARHLEDLGDDAFDADDDAVLATLGARFTVEDLERSLTRLRVQRPAEGMARLAERFARIAAGTWAVEYPVDSTLAERVLMPRAPAESNGIEDVRMLRLVGPDGGVTYAGTYTAYDGRAISLQLLRSTDLRRFDAAPLSGPGARDKGLAIFPRQVGGRFLAMSRADQESNAVAASDDLVHWDSPVRVEAPDEPWGLVQLGNCGPPVETERGWVVLTHGVGPMRTYSIGALLLDLDDPTRVLGRLREPLLSPAEDERSGYVPNAVYSCGALLHGRTLVVPYGCSDSRARIATVELDPLLDALAPERPVRHRAVPR
ncbi:glycoside hydrolase family 130 protein [Actinotalea solisilvae]|uniref:glycoside hydrolase family 130 protein n=1 Tax=Actinotalea solisilvae TaxID=2072922 RepID=UPI0018F26018|nr:glycoside hydrolase family 130 protein [Actinotalea solisilvae]